MTTDYRPHPYAGARAGFTATVPGFPSIGPYRELKFAVEEYWRDPSTAAELTSVAVRNLMRSLRKAADAGLDSLPVGTFSFYDRMLDAAAMLGALPARVGHIPDHVPVSPEDLLPDWIDRYFAAARGADGIAPLEMTKWFDTNYHHLVPELDPSSPFEPDPAYLLQQLRRVRTLHVGCRAVLIGPATFLALSRTTDGSDPLDRLPELVDAHLAILDDLAEAGVRWVQYDEPALNTDHLDPARDGAVAREWSRLVAHAHARGLRVLAQTYFADADRAVATLAESGIDAFGADLVAGRVPDLSPLPASVGLVAGVVDGRNVWRTDMDARLAQLRELAHARPIAVSASCSLLHVPYSLTTEPTLSEHPRLRARLAFAREKLDEVAALAHELHHPTGAGSRAFVAARRALAEIAVLDDVARPSGVSGTSGVSDIADVASGAGAAGAPGTSVAADTAGAGAPPSRPPFTERAPLQRAALDLPILPTSTIGSFPQTAGIRKARSEHRAGRLSDAAYQDAMRDEVAHVVRAQEELGLDVLVHGEPERNDMVQYFAEQLEGFHCTSNAWVQSYGTRCVRPPILHGPVSRPEPMTVEWFRAAQDLTNLPVKGMLTGPVTMLAWSFVRDDRPIADVAHEVALAVRAECADLVAAGARVIQVDEAAIRELRPLRDSDRADYARWSVESFRIATGGIPPEVQLHTHMCYSDFRAILDLITGMDADVTTIEAARGGSAIVDAIAESGFPLPVAPGVWDIHSPRVPSEEEIAGRIRHAVDALGAARVWVVPDCGLKTRGWEETRAALANLVAATHRVRDEVAAGVRD